MNGYIGHCDKLTPSEMTDEFSCNLTWQTSQHKKFAKYKKLCKSGLWIKPLKSINMHAEKHMLFASLPTCNNECCSSPLDQLLTWCSRFSTAGNSCLQPPWQTLTADAPAPYALAHAAWTTQHIHAGSNIQHSALLHVFHSVTKYSTSLISHYSSRPSNQYAQICTSRVVNFEQ